MNILTKSVAKEVTDAGLKNIRDMQFINTPVEASAVEIFYGKHFYFHIYPKYSDIFTPHHVCREDSSISIPWTDLFPIKWVTV